MVCVLGFGFLKAGDHIGFLLDLDEAWLRFYRNGKRFGPGFTSGVTGPLVRAMISSTDDKPGENGGGSSTVRALPGAYAPAGAGGTDEPWEEQEAMEGGDY